MNWPTPGNDPFYMYNPTDNMARKNYYGIAGTPSMKCDGVLSPSPTTASLNSALSQRSPVDAPVDIYFDVTVGTNIAVDAEVTAESYFSGNNLKFHAVLIGESIDTSGTAGWLQSHYEDVMLDMAPSASGQSFNITQSQTVELQASFPIPAITSIENLAVIAFVQNDATREILNARHMVLFPSLTVYQTFVFDMAGGNGNMIPEAGETCDLWVTLENSVNGAYASDVNCILSTDDPDITITDGDAAFGDVGPGAFVMNADNAFVFDVSAALQTHVATFELEITANAGDYYKLERFNLMVGVPEILLVDDDSGNNYELEIINSLTQANFAFDQWTVATSGAPSAQYLLDYDKVVWITGRADHPLNEAEQEAISGYLDGDGKLLISSENLSDDLAGSDFLTNYMHCQHDIDNVNINFLNGVPGDPITDGMTIDMNGGAYLPDDQSSIIPDAEAVTILMYDNTAEDVAALRYESDDYMLVFLAFPLESVSEDEPGYTTRTELLSAIIDWFNYSLGIEPETGADVVPHDYDLVSVYPNPFNPQTTISLNIIQSGMVDAVVYNLLGEKVNTLYSGMTNSGRYEFTFDGADLTSGVYLLKVDTPAGTAVEKMILMK